MTPSDAALARRFGQRIWPGEIVMLLEFWWIERVPTVEIARRLNTTRNAVIGFTWQHGFVYRPGMNSRHHRRDGIALSPRYIRQLEREKENERPQPERRDGAIFGSTLPPLRSLTP